MIDRQTRLHARHRHIERLDRRIKDLTQREDMLSRRRLGVFFFGAVAAFFSAGFDNVVTLVVVALWIAAFMWAVVVHGRIKRTLALFRAARRIHADRRARMMIDWVNLPPNTATAPATHPFASDIDIVGDYSLHRLLDTCDSRGGSERLLAWLLATEPDAAAIVERQADLRERIPMRGFIERLHITAATASDAKRGTQWDGRPLVGWLESVAGEPSVKWPTVLLLAGLAFANLALFTADRAGILPPLWIATFAVYVLLSGTHWSRLGGMFNEALKLQNALEGLRAVFAHLEDDRHPPRLREKCAPFLTDDRPSQQLRRIAVIVSAASIQRNPVVWIVLNLLIPYDVFFAYLLGLRRGDLAARLPGWLETWYDIEAVNALATFAHLNPRYTFPHLQPSPALKGEQMGHPLIPHDERVCNDFGLDELGRVVIITGSNMSGKSSFLRTVGLNMTLAYAGSVVPAESLRVGHFRLFTCIRVADSVVDGISYFYAEVKRLKALLDALKADHPAPLFFLIDEIFRGTNNRERLIGSESFIRALVGEPSMGLISTHDLELVNLADDIAQISNYHFREHIAGGRMVFDYVLRSGPSPTTNALKIMMIEGLPVRESPA